MIVRSGRMVIVVDVIKVIIEMDFGFVDVLVLIME